MASFTSSTLNGLMMPTMSFMSPRSLLVRGRSHALERVAGLRVLAEIEPGLLVFLRHPDAAGQDLAEHEHDAERHGERPHHRGHDREHLLAEQAEPTPEEHAVGPGGVDRRVGEEAEQ